MQHTLQEMWVDKYRPAEVDSYVFHDHRLQQAVEKMLADKSIPQLIFAGVQGTGKTTLARILISAMDIDPSDVMVINGSLERGIDIFRNKVENFAMSMAMGPYKIIHLEESDKLTPDAQNALKAFMEDVSGSVRFIFTCNHVNKIIPPIRSRCQEYFFTSGDQDDVAEYLIGILAAEKVKFSLDLLDEYIQVGFPDIRKITHLLQQNSFNGELKAPQVASGSGEYRNKLLEYIEKDQWTEARKVVCASVSYDEWENLFRYVYENINSAPKFKDPGKWDEAIITIADHLYKHTLVADPEINVAAMFIRLGQI